MDLRQRVLRILETCGMSKTEIANKLGVSLSVLSHLYSGRNNPGTDFLVELLKLLPTINPQWLMLGEGDMYVKKKDGLEKIDLLNVIAELKTINSMNYKNIKDRLDDLEKLIIE